jgi:ABC-type transport system involved in multi-copper enzyme maturation permease subunit
LEKSEGTKKPNQTNSKWWLAAILLPVIGFCVGYLRAINAPHNQSDWFGFSVLIPISLGLLIGCALSCIATIISVVKREKFYGIALLAGIPSLIFVVNFCSQIPQAAKMHG